MATNEIQVLIVDFASKIEALARKDALAQVIAQLGGGDVPIPYRARQVGRRPGRPKGSGRAAGSPITAVQAGKRRSAEDVERMGEALVSHVKANPGQRGDQIAAALNSDVSTIRLPMRALIASKKITTRGQRRGMQYFAAGAAPRGPASMKKRGRRGKKK